MRRVALVQVGGVATETIAEDFHTTIKMHRRGWRTRYHNQVLVQGLAPVDLDGYLLQRDRWARGNLAVFRLPESPLRRNGLDVRQRVAYFASLFAYGAGFEPGSHVRLATTVATVDGPYRSISIEAVVRSCRPAGPQAWRLGAEILEIDEESERALVTFCHVVYPWRQLRPVDHVAPVEAPIEAVAPRPRPAPVAVPASEPASARSRADLLDALRREVAALDRALQESSRRPEPARPNERQGSETSTR